MALFSISNSKANKLERQEFANEKELQHFVEINLDELFGIHFLATEFTISNGGRIDTLGIDENNAPVIIEYKWGENNTIINQGLFYLDWLFEHFADFQILAQQKLGKDIEIDRGSPRLILIAASYSKFDGYAINRMAENIEMWTYNKYRDILELRLVASSQSKESGIHEERKRATKISYEEYATSGHLEGKSETVKELFKEIQDRIMAFDNPGAIEEVSRKMYVAYRTNRNFVYINFRNNKLFLDVCLTPDKINSVDKSHIRDVTKVGHHGAGYSRFELNEFDQLEEATKLLKESYESTK
jgi:predicted transport protein